MASSCSVRQRPESAKNQLLQARWNMLVPSRRRLRFEVWIVLGLSLGQSAVYSVVQLLDKMSRAPLAEGTSTLNQSRSSREYFDLTYQLLDIVFALVPVLLVIYFLTDQRQAAAGGARTAARRSGNSASTSPGPAVTCCRALGWQRSSGFRRWASTPRAVRWG